MIQQFTHRVRVIVGEPAVMHSLYGHSVQAHCVMSDEKTRTPEALIVAHLFPHIHNQSIIITGNRELADRQIPSSYTASSSLSNILAVLATLWAARTTSTGLRNLAELPRASYWNSRATEELNTGRISIHERN